MTLDRGDLLRAAAATSFGVEPLEKAIRLLELTEGLRSHPFLRHRLVLKGGTALNLFLFDLPRLSIDIDLNYIGALDRATMISERPGIEQAIHAVCRRLGLVPRHVPSEHAGGKWRVGFESVMGRPGTLELDVNFLLRAPLWPPASVDSHSIGGVTARAVPVLDINELTAGKLVALFDRAASRDLFDARNLLASGRLDRGRLRTALMVYCGAGRRDWRDISLDAVQADPAEVASRLLPVLRGAGAPPRNDVVAWSERLTRDCRELLSWLLPLGEHELEFLRLINERGEISGSLLTEGEPLRSIIEAHPALRWKAWNVRKQRGISRIDDSGIA